MIQFTRLCWVKRERTMFFISPIINNLIFCISYVMSKTWSLIFFNSSLKCTTSSCCFSSGDCYKFWIVKKIISYFIGDSLLSSKRAAQQRVQSQLAKTKPHVKYLDNHSSSRIYQQANVSSTICSTFFPWLARNKFSFSSNLYVNQRADTHQKAIEIDQLLIQSNCILFGRRKDSHPSCKSWRNVIVFRCFR